MYSPKVMGFYGKNFYKYEKKKTNSLNNSNDKFKNYIFYKNIKDDPSIPKWISAVFFLVIIGFIGMIGYFLYFAIINGSEYINNLDNFSLLWIMD